MTTQELTQQAQLPPWQKELAAEIAWQIAGQLTPQLQQLHMLLTELANSLRTADAKALAEQKRILDLIQAKIDEMK